MEISLGFSPCPNDTFIFYALVNNKIETGGLTFIPHIADIEALNESAFAHSLMVTKISFNAYIRLVDHYIILNTGSALGQNCGPLLIAKKITEVSALTEKTIAVPGEHTTAHFLLNFFLPKLKFKKFLLFNQIEDAVLSNEVDAGVIIHENRFTYKDKGLLLIQDLGNFWESKTGTPIPLGGIAIRRDLSGRLAEKVDRCIYNSLQYARNHEEEVMDYCRSYAQNMETHIMKSHISLYVNEFTSNLGDKGRNSILRFFEEAYRLGRGSEEFKHLFEQKTEAFKDYIFY